MSTNYSNAQCLGADNCDKAKVFCSLDQMNGFMCINMDYSNTNICLPCKRKDKKNMDVWWAFVSTGGLVEFTLDDIECSNPNNGIQFGIVSSCDCKGDIACNTDCTSATKISVTAVLEPCKVYYLWVDGCDLNFCSFTLKTTKGIAPEIKDLSLIRRSNPKNICKGCCTDFWVDPQPSQCTLEYVWTLDGTEIAAGPSEKVTNCFPDEGTFELCVTAFLGLRKNKSICDSKSKCTTVIVVNPQNKTAKPLTLCHNQIPYIWNCDTITKSGTYTCAINQNGCCKFDSSITIEVLSPPIPVDKYYIACPGEMYIDNYSKDTFSTCQNGTEVILQNSTKPNRCDSSYLLYALFPNYIPRWKTYCNNDTITHEPRMKSTHVACTISATYEESYVWYNKSDSTKIISTDDILYVTKEGTYCLRYSVKTSLGPVSKTCSWIYCETQNETSLKNPTVQLSGQLLVKSNEQLNYIAQKSDTSILVKYIWKIKGGTILTPNAQDSSEIRVLWDKLDTTNYVCVSIMTECTTSPEQCINITKQTNTAISDLNKYSIINILPNPNNGNFIISWDKNLFVNKLSIISAGGKEIYESKISKNHTDIHIKDLKLKPGIYYARLNSKDKIYTKAFVVQ